MHICDLAKMPDNKFLYRKCTSEKKNLITMQYSTLLYKDAHLREHERDCFFFFTIKDHGHILDVFTWYNNIALRLWSILYFIQNDSHKIYADYVTVT